MTTTTARETTCLHRATRAAWSTYLRRLTLFRATTLTCRRLSSTTPTQLPLVGLAEGLHRAAAKGDVAAVQVLLAQGALVREDDQHGKSAIHLAAHHCHAGIVELLKTQHGVSIDEHDTAGKTQLVCEAESGNMKQASSCLRTAPASTPRTSSSRPLCLLPLRTLISRLLTL